MTMSLGYWARTWALAGLVIGCGVVPHETQAQGPGRGDPVRVIVAPGLVLAGGTELESGIGGVGHLALERGLHRVLLRLAAVHFQHCPDGTAELPYYSGCSTVGIPVVGEAGIGGTVVGIAIQGFVNLNAEAPFGGLGVSLPLGWMP